MPFWRTYYHLVWGTKNKSPLITPQLENRLYPYIVERAGELGVYVHAINGWIDHTHLIAVIPPKLAISQTIQKLKGTSSHFVTDNELVDHEFKWQRGYGVLSLGHTQLERAIEYVDNQKRHHTDQTTNQWLERIEKPDEGPSDDLQNYSNNQVIRESLPDYIVGDGWDFP